MAEFFALFLYLVWIFVNEYYYNFKSNNNAKIC